MDLEDCAEKLTAVWPRSPRSHYMTCWLIFLGVTIMDGDDPQYAKDIKGSHNPGKHHEPPTVGRPVSARFIKRFSHRHSVCLCIFLPRIWGFRGVGFGRRVHSFFHGTQALSFSIWNAWPGWIPIWFFDLCDIPQKPSPEASTQASLRDAWQQTAAPEHCVGWFYPAYWCGASGLSLD